MTNAPYGRGACSVCGREFNLTSKGFPRVHVNLDEPAFDGHMYCKGAALPPRAQADVAEPVAKIATAIVELQAQIQIYTCRSCNGHGKQGMALEPYNTLPCLRCHGEGVTHEVPPGCYDAVLTALLDALGGATVEQVTTRLAPLLGANHPLPAAATDTGRALNDDTNPQPEA